MLHLPHFQLEIRHFQPATKHLLLQLPALIRCLIQRQPLAHAIWPEKIQLLLAAQQQPVAAIGPRLGSILIHCLSVSSMTQF
jgi:hypothetical protein